MDSYNRDRYCCIEYILSIFFWPKKRKNDTIKTSMRVMRNYTLVIGIFTILAIVFFITRLYHLTSLPIFTDEAIYLRWAQIAKNDATWRFISLTDGKQPMFVWLVIPFMKFIHDPLMAGRAVSVMAGFFSLVGLFFLGKELFKSMWVGLLAAFLYLIFPMGVVYDRMALYDSLVAAFLSGRFMEKFFL